MRFVVVAAVVGWLAFEGAAVVCALSGSAVLAWLAEVAAVLTAALLWLYGTRGGGVRFIVSIYERKARG